MFYFAKLYQLAYTLTIYALDFIHSMVLIDSITPLLILKYQL